jgi:transaldolase
LGAAASLDERQVYRALMVEDVRGALEALRPVYDASQGEDGFVSLELPPGLAFDTQASIEAAEALHREIQQPNLLIKVPATREGVAAFRELTRRGWSINVTLLFSLQRYEEIVDAYLDGLAARPGDLSWIHSVASFFVGRVDHEVNRLLTERGQPEALALRNQVAVAQARLAYRIFQERFGAGTFRELRRRGARPQRLLWASTGVKSPGLPRTFYAEQLVGPDTVATLPEEVLEAVAEGGILTPSLTQDVTQARALLERLDEQDISLDDVASTLEDDGVRKFMQAYLSSLEVLRGEMHGRGPRP